MGGSGELDNGLTFGALIEANFASNIDYRTALNDGGNTEEDSTKE